MKNPTLKISISIIALVILMFMTGLVFIVDETQQVVVTQFGKPVGKPITAPGLHFKKPVIQQAHYFEKRLLKWDGDPNQIPTKDKK
ncbi:MAG: protease modulator HflC, partial [Candidatus Omnitrophica bacterium]|nr:protease modulator HflC [Candidatus Omnitrophota bacterium]